MTTAVSKEGPLQPYQPDYAVSPGEILQEFLEEQSMTQVELARRLGVTTKHLNQLIAGLVSLSNELAIALERVTGIPARFWNALAMTYREATQHGACREGLGDVEHMVGGWS